MPGITKLVSSGIGTPESYLITDQLWENIGNWCSALKKKAHTYIRERYTWDVENRRQVNADIARGLLERGNFLKHGMGEVVS